VPALVSFSKIIGRVNDSVIEDVERHMLGIASGVQMD
jgi:hypothetical protein